MIAPPATVPAGKAGASSRAPDQSGPAPVMAPPAIVPAPKLGAIGRSTDGLSNRSRTVRAPERASASVTAASVDRTYGSVGSTSPGITLSHVVAPEASWISRRAEASSALRLYPKTGSKSSCRHSLENVPPETESRAVTLSGIPSPPGEISLSVGNCPDHVPLMWYWLPSSLSGVYDPLPDRSTV